MSSFVMSFLFHSTSMYFYIFQNVSILYHCQVDTVNNFDDDSWPKETDVVPECLLSHLTTCSLRNYCRINCEIHFAKYILKNSRVLNTMTIQIAESVDTNTKIQTIEELSLCQRNSTTCDLLFI